MNAIRVHQTGGPDVLQLEEMPDPVAGPGEAVVKLEAIGVNYIEVYQRTGLYPLAVPFVPGREGSGIVTAIGKDVTLVKVGDRVVSESLNGAYAEFATVQADRLVVLRRRCRHQDSGGGDAPGPYGALSRDLNIQTHARRLVSRARGSWWRRPSALPDRFRHRRDGNRHDIDRGQGGARP